MRIVIVEDELRIREGLANLIRKVTPEHEIVGEAENGLAGLALIQKTEPDLIVTDIRMPEMDGLQMLERAQQQTKEAEIIILSAYSDFHYAQQCIKLDVSEYLLKPITVGNLIQALENAKARYVKKQNKRWNPSTLHSPLSTIINLIGGGFPLDEELDSFLQSQYGIDSKGRFAVLYIDLGEEYDVHYAGCRKRMEAHLHNNGFENFVSLAMEERKSLAAVFFKFPVDTVLKRILVERVLPEERKMNRASHPSSFGLIFFDGLATLRESLQTIEQSMEWCIALDDDALILYPEVAETRTLTLTYPHALENEMRTALCANNRERFGRAIRGFQEKMHDGSIYLPGDIKKCYIRLLMSMIHILNEIGSQDFDPVELQTILQKVSKASRRRQLIDLLNAVERSLFERDMSSDCENVLVKRAQNMVHELYRQGITLMEIASRLNVTPAYLGAQFQLEIGESFSNFIRSYRLEKAKELLIGTNLKMYEISKMVGYNDPKYFSRVFKGTIGVMPVEYRRRYR